ncbi:hypothetical protein D3C71_1242920 [compost metagenome]
MLYVPMGGKILIEEVTAVGKNLIWGMSEIEVLVSEKIGEKYGSEGTFDPWWSFEEFKENNKGVLVCKETDLNEILNSLEDDLGVSFKNSGITVTTAFIEIAAEAGSLLSI